MAASGLMKGALALAGLGAVAGLAIWMGSSDSDSDRSGSAVVKGGKQSSETGMELPEGVAGEAALLTPTPMESLAVALDAPDADSPAGSAQEAAGPQTLLTGRVVDTNGRPIKDARIVFHADEGPRLIRLGGEADDSIPDNPETHTDARGVFEVPVAIPAERDGEDDDLPSFMRGGSQLAVAHEGFATLISDTPELSEGETDLGSFTMETGTVVVGRVVDESGRAIAGATVTGQHLANEGGRGRGMMRFLSGRLIAEYNRAVTGADGRFHVTGLPAGKAELTAEAEGRQLGFLEDLELEVGASQDVGDIALAAGAMIAGFVVDSEGSPVVGAAISVSSMARIVVRRMEDMPRQQIGHEMRLRAETDEDGYFEMIGLGIGQYTVHVNADGFARSSTENVPTGTRDLSVRLEALGELLVTLRNSVDDTPIRGAELTATARSDGPFRFGGGSLEVVESEDVPGEYTVFGAGPSGLDLVVAADGFATLEAEGPSVLNGGEGSLQVLLIPESIISGMVLDMDGKGIADARVRITEYVPPAQDHGNGRFEMRREVSHRFGGEEEVDLMRESTRTVTDDSGRFEMRGVPAGDWEIVARADDFVESAPQVLTVDVGQSHDGVTMELEIGGAVVGHVTSADGTPIAEVTVIVRPKSVSGNGGGGGQVSGRLAALLGEGDGPDGPKRATTRKDGSFEVRSLNPGVYEVELAKQSGMNFGRAMVFMDDGTSGSGNDDDIQFATVVAGEEATVNIIQAPMATLEGRVVAGGEPVEVVLVSLNEKGSFMPFGGKQVETDRFGNYVFENVEPGEYEVSTLVPGAALEEKQPVTLEPGRTSEADLVFGGATLIGRVVDKQSGEGARDVTIVLSPIEDSSPEPQEQGQATFEVVMVSRGGGGGGGGMSMSFGGGSQSKVRTDANGDFEVRWLKPGKYSIETLGGAYVNGEAGPIEVEDGESLDDVLIEVDRGATITGVVVSGATGEPLSGAPVSLGSSGSREMTMTEGGRFTFEGLDAGDYTIEVMGSGFGGPPVASQAVALDVGELRELNLTTEG